MIPEALRQDGILGNKKTTNYELVVLTNEALVAGVGLEPTTFGL